MSHEGPGNAPDPAYAALLTAVDHPRVKKKKKRRRAKGGHFLNDDVRPEQSSPFFGREREIYYTHTFTM